ncbi:hypothetical protein HYW21_04220 [Candidatus Woesearchaeota archaeon]|nr:hypothetical protein [Candidatus Woesearchaeota archaeon]
MVDLGDELTQQFGRINSSVSGLGSHIAQQGQSTNNVQSPSQSDAPSRILVVGSHPKWSVENLRQALDDPAFSLEYVVDHQDGESLGDQVALLFDQAYHGKTTYHAVLIVDPTITANVWARIARFPDSYGNKDGSIPLSRYIHLLYPATQVVTVSDGTFASARTALSHGDYAHLSPQIEPGDLALVVRSAAHDGAERQKTQRKVMRDFRELFSPSIAEVTNAAKRTCTMLRGYHHGVLTDEIVGHLSLHLQTLSEFTALLYGVVNRSIQMYRSGQTVAGKPKVLVVGYDTVEHNAFSSRLPQYDVTFAPHLRSHTAQDLNPNAVVVVKDAGSYHSHNGASSLLDEVVSLAQTGYRGRVIILGELTEKSMDKLQKAWPVLYDIFPCSTGGETLYQRVREGVATADFEHWVREKLLGSLNHHVNNVTTSISGYAQLIQGVLTSEGYLSDRSLGKLSVIESSISTLELSRGTFDLPVHRMEINPYNGDVYDLRQQAPVLPQG